MSTPPLDILIIGAGPVGLATAVGALHRGAERVLVVEQARELRPIGRNLDFLPNAVRALEAIAPGLRQRFEPFVRIPKPGKVRALTVSTSGSPILSQETADYGTTGSILWWQLQRLLLDALPDPRILVLNHQLVNIVHEVGTGLACAEFVANRQRKNIYKNWDDNGSEDDLPNAVPVPEEYSSMFEVCEKKGEDGTVHSSSEIRVRCRAKVIVGADGINSVARKCVYRDTGGWGQYAEAVYSGFTRVAATGSPPLSFDDERFLEEQYMRNSEICMVTCGEGTVSSDSMRIMVAHPQRDSKVPFSWHTGYCFAVDGRTVKNSSPEDLACIALDVARKEGLSEKLLQVSRQIWDSQSGNNYSTLPYYVVPATHPPPFSPLKTGGEMKYPPDFKRPWHFKRVVLAGDAVHAAPPFLAEGAAMGLEDALVLVTGLAAAGLFSAADGISLQGEELDCVFKRYRSSRLDRVCFFQNRTLNRASEYDHDAMQEIRDTLWAYDPLTAVQGVSFK